MSTLRISDAPLLPNVDGTEKIPTGGRGDYSVSVDQIKTFAQGGLPQQIENHINDTNNPHQVTKDQVGLGSVDNTSDIDKPISVATQEALNLKANTTYVDAALNLKSDKTYVDGQDNLKLDKSEKGASGGLATLDSSGKIPRSELPSFVDLTTTIPTYKTPEAGVDPVTGVTDGAYYNVRSSNDESYVNEYQNIGGVATATGKSYLSSLGVQQQEKPASTIKDSSGKTQQKINDLNLLNNPVGLFDINGSGDETVKLQALLDTLPKNITLDPNKTYSTTGKLFVKSDCVIDGQGATINCTAPISTLEMTGSNITALTKGAFTITVADASIFSIFDDILVYYNEDNSDTWYTTNQLNLDELGITTQKNQILGISGNVLTLKFANESKLSDLPARVSTVYKIHQNELIIKNVTFNITSSSWVWLRCSGIRHQNCKFKKVGSLSGLSNQMCYMPTFLDCEVGEGLSLGFNYGTYNWQAERNTLYAGRSSDGLLVTYAGTNLGTSRSNKFLVRNMPALAENAGLYWGAKSRNCHSYDDVVVGLDYGFRVMFGAQQCSINNMTTKSIGTFSGFISYSGVEINNFTGYDKPIRSINADNLTIKGGFLFSTDKTATPLLLDLHRNLTSDIRNNYHVEGLRCEGKASVTLGVNGFKLLNNNFKVFDHYASAISKNWDIRGNTAGSMRFSAPRDFKISGNTIDESLATNAVAYGLQFRGNAHVTEFEGNTIKHSIVGVNRELESSQIYLAKGANNNIIAPVQLDIGRSSLPAASAEFDELCGVGFEILASDYYANGKHWTKTVTGWKLGVGASATATYDPPSLSASGSVGDSVTTTVTLTGVAVGQTVQASFDKYNAGVRIYPVVSAVNTVTVEFRNISAAPVDLASGTLTVKLI